jgi:transcriptional/translational regulatory protein YebC/TACO1
MRIRETLQKEGFEIESSEVSMLPKTTVDLEEKQAHQNLKLLRKLEELDDIQTVSSNVNFTEEILNSYEE